MNLDNIFKQLQATGPLAWWQALNFQGTIEFDTINLVNFAKSAFFFKALGDKKTAHEFSCHYLYNNPYGENSLVVNNIINKIIELGYITIYSKESEFDNLKFLSLDNSVVVLSYNNKGFEELKVNVITTEQDMVDKIKVILNSNENMSSGITQPKQHDVDCGCKSCVGM